MSELDRHADAIIRESRRTRDRILWFVYPEGQTHSVVRLIGQRGFNVKLGKGLEFSVQKKGTKGTT